MPLMLPLRQWPQTLLLTALALLIAAATIMLACGPAAQPIPDDGDIFWRRNQRRAAARSRRSLPLHRSPNLRTLRRPTLRSA